MTDDDNQGSGDRFIRKSTILADLPIHASTLDEWIKIGRFPEPVVLNPGALREIVAWRERDYLNWKADRPQRQAKVGSLEGRRKRKAKPKAKPEAEPEPKPEAEPKPEPRIIITRPK